MNTSDACTFPFSYHMLWTMDYTLWTIDHGRSTTHIPFSLP